MKSILFETLRAETPEEIAKRIVKDAQTGASIHMALGKMVAALDEKRDEKQHKTLKKYVSKLVKDKDGKPLQLEPATYKVAKAFAGVFGEGHGTITEPQFDACRLKWVLTVSAILGHLEALVAEDAAKWKEQMCVALRAATSKTQSILDLIKEQVAPESDGEGEGDDEGKVAEMPIVLSADLIRRIRDALNECEDPGILDVMGKGFTALAEIATGRHAELSKPAEIAA